MHEVSILLFFFLVLLSDSAHRLHNWYIETCGDPLSCWNIRRQTRFEIAVRHHVCFCCTSLWVTFTQLINALCLPGEVSIRRTLDNIFRIAASLELWVGLFIEFWWHRIVLADKSSALPVVSTWCWNLCLSEKFRGFIYLFLLVEGECSCIAESNSKL